MADDYAGDNTTTGSLATGGTVTGTLETAGDADWFRVSLAAGFAYQFNLVQSANFSGTDSTMSLIRGNSVVASSFNPSMPLIAAKTITYTPASTDAGTYFISVSASSSGIGGYTLSENPADDYSADFSANAGTLTVGGPPTTAALQTGADHDYFAVFLVAGTTYRFRVADAASPGIGLNEQILNVDGNSSSSSGSGLNPAGYNDFTMTVSPITTGTFYLDVYSGSNGIGSYTITATTLDLRIYRFFDSANGTQFLTTNESESNTIAKTRPDLISQQNSFTAAALADPNASPVYRFFDINTGTHFFTSSSIERDTVQSTRPDLKFEGVGFNEYATAQATSSPVYRFFDTKNGTHFFTGSVMERATILTTRPDLTPEGIAFYAPTTFL